MVGEEKRHQMMQNLFGDQSEEEEEEEVESEHESNRQPGNASEEDGGQEPEVEGEAEAEVEGQWEAEIESDVEVQDASQEHGESDGERDQSSQEVDTGDHREESGEKSTESDEKTLYAQRAATSRRRDTVNSASERSEDNHYTDQDEEVNQTGNNRSPSLEKDEANFPDSAPEIRDVFGDSDEEEPAEHETRNQIEDDSNRSPLEEEDFDKELKPEDMIADEEGHHEFEEEHVESRIKEKPAGPPLELEIPLRPPPAHPDKMNMIKVSNIMGIDQRPFDPKTYVEEDQFVTDESGSRQRIRLENNIVRWRRVTKPDGTKTIESNARFVRWSDGSLQLLLGNEVLDISVQDSQHDQAHLFLRHKKGILQSQGRILKKMRFMPSSLSSNSHRLLTALVDSRHKKVNRVKNCITDIDPEREKEQKERIASQTIKANELLNKKKEKVNRKYSSQRKGRQLSPGFIDDEDDYRDSRSSRRYDDDLEKSERILNAKKGNTSFFRKPSKDALKSSRQRMDHSESDREESEYETEGEEDEGSPARETEDVEEDYEEEEEEAEADEESEEEAEEPRRKTKESGSSLKRKAIESDDEDSPPRKAAPQRRMAMVYSDDDE